MKYAFAKRIIYNSLFFFGFILFFTLVKHPNIIFAQCSGAGCSQLNCSLPGFESDSPCTRGGGCCYPQGDGSYACRDPLVATPNPGSICAAPATPTAVNTNTPTVPSNPPTAPPTTPATPTNPTGTPGAPCIVGQSSGCSGTLSCVCPSGGFNCNIGSPGQCIPHAEVCGPNPAMGCVGNADCARTCGVSSAECRGGSCWDDGPAETGSIAPCVGAGMSCTTAALCNNGTTVCGYNNGLRCETAGTICCVQSACTTPPPVETGQRFAYVECANNGIKTGLGCIPTDPAAFIRQILTIGIGLGGGIAFLLILLGGFKVIMSQGNPEAMSEGRDLITSAIAGLMLIIFSVFILRFIGVNILGLPGFS